MTDQRHSHNRLFRVIDEFKASFRDMDAVGGSAEAAGAGEFSDVCLVTACRNLGVPVPYTTSGPFRALRDGNEMLRPWGVSLVHSPLSDVVRGYYIVWLSPCLTTSAGDGIGHFVAVRVGDRGV